MHFYVRPRQVPKNCKIFFYVFYCETRRFEITKKVIAYQNKNLFYVYNEIQAYLIRYHIYINFIVNHVKGDTPAWKSLRGLLDSSRYK